MKIGIATPSIVQSDAVSNDVIGMYLSLKKDGHEPVLFAEHSAVPFPVSPIEQIKNLNIYIYHHSIYCNLGVKFFKELNCRKIVKYHNITPPHFFQKNTNIYDTCEAGLHQLNQILEQKCEVWVDSEYNGLEMCKIKQCKFKVIPPFNQVDMLMEAVEDAKTVLPFNDWNTNILMVGRLAANKDILAGVEGFAHYTKNNKYSRLIIVGEDSGEYANTVKQRIIDLKLRNVVITGKVSLQLLKAFYLIADVLLITSKHEGFCVPMVEAMAMNLPIIANKNCALPYTGSDAVYYAETTEEISKAINCIISDPIEFIAKGQNSFRIKYNNNHIEKLVLSAINSIEAK